MTGPVPDVANGVAAADCMGTQLPGTANLGSLRAARQIKRHLLEVFNLTRRNNS
jgi:hypothetical protein